MTRVATAGFVFLFWLVAAAMVTATQAGEVVTIATLLVTAFAYTRLVARESGITHALGVGIAWLSLSICAEIAVHAHLLGSPDRPLLRNVILFAWVFAPALFARRETH